MASSDNISMAVFCDFENVALGVRDANYEKFDIKPVLERLLLKGSITVKKSYCDWERYKSFKAGMHEANFELIEIPHVRQSGKNSADIRLVVDALDLCYTKSHVNTFVIISGDSDFSPLVSKLRENNKQVIGVGVKQSTSDLLVANCDEFIFYDDLVREQRRAAAKRDERKAQPQAKRPPADENNRRKEELEARKTQALEMVAETFDALVSERGDTGKIWASLLKDTLKRRRPDFSESYYGFRTFGNLLEEAQTRGLFEFGRDEKSGTYVFRSSGGPAASVVMEHAVLEAAPEAGEEVQAQPEARPEARPEGKGEARRGRGRGGRKQGGARGEAEQAQAPEQQFEVAPEHDEEMQPPPEARLEGKGEARRGRGRGGRKQGAARTEPLSELQQWQEQIHELEHAAQDEVVAQAPEAEAPQEAEAQPAAKERRRAPRKTAAQKLAEAAHATEMDEAPRRRAARAQAEPAVAEPAAEEAVAEGAEAEGAGEKPARKRAAKAPARAAAPRSRRPAKPKATPDNG